MFLRCCMTSVASSRTCQPRRMPGSQHPASLVTSLLMWWCEGTVATHMFMTHACYVCIMIIHVSTYLWTSTAVLLPGMHRFPLLSKWRKGGAPLMPQPQPLLRCGRERTGVEAGRTAVGPGTGMMPGQPCNAVLPCEQPAERPSGCQQCAKSFSPGHAE